jgi:hypothetical protein
MVGYAKIRKIEKNVELRKKKVFIKKWKTWHCIMNKA